MSYFTNMFGDTESGFTSYLLQVDSHGAVVIYKLDKDGKPSSMRTGEVRDVLGGPIKALGLRIVRMGPAGSSKPPFYPWNFGLDGNRWCETVKILNGKGKRAGCNEHQMERLDRADVDVSYVERQQERPWKWILTDAGRAMDEMIDNK